MTGTVLAIRHVAFEDLGTFAPLLTERGYRLRYLDAGVDPINEDAARDADLLIALGGPIAANDLERHPFLRDELRVIEARIARGQPVLGVCLGAQLLASALGAAVTPTGRAEIGYSPLTLTTAGEAGVLAPLADQPVLHWHGDHFEIPAGATRLAETRGFPNQAFSRGRNILGLQFHLEPDHTQIERWLIGHAHELAAHGLDPQLIRADAQQHGPQLAENARAVLGAWLDGLAKPGGRSFPI